MADRLCEQCRTAYEFWAVNYLSVRPPIKINLTLPVTFAGIDQAINGAVAKTSEILKNRLAEVMEDCRAGRHLPPIGAKR